MLIRTATLALLIAVLGAAPASAQKLNYLAQVIDLTELIPPPPPRPMTGITSLPASIALPA